MLLSQLKHQIHIKVVCEDVEIFIDTFADGGSWQMQARLFTGHGALPKHVKEILTSMHLFRWQSNGPYLKANREMGTVDLITTITPITSFIEFKKTVKSFLEVYSLWDDFLSEKKSLSL